MMVRIPTIKVRYEIRPLSVRDVRAMMKANSKMAATNNGTATTAVILTCSATIRARAMAMTAARIPPLMASFEDPGFVLRVR